VKAARVRLPGWSQRPAMPDPAAVIRLVEDDAPLAQAIAERLRTAGLVVRRYSTASEFLEARDWNEPGCLVLDWHLPDITGGELQRRLNRVGVRLPIVAISGQARPTFAARMVERGAVRFVEKPFRMDELLEAVNLALDRDRKERTRHRKLDDFETRLARLTNREFETMLLLERGMSSKVIAGEFGLSERTVEQHRAAVWRKLELGSAAELAKGLADYRLERAERLRERSAAVRAGRKGKPGET
jgi:FixJ family two-component response regulator